jgi:neutral ceramidase
MSYRIGTGKRDITGSAAELGMLGMADADQKTAGILSRLFARTFVIEEQGNHVAIVTADIMSCTLAVKEEVVRRLGDLEELKDGAGNPIFTRDNVLICGTHTHSGPGGYSHYALYNLSILGFDEQNFNCIVDGIVKSIHDAFQGLAPGDIFFNQGELLECGRNRSLEAYDNNPVEERDGQPNTDTEMVLLKFVSGDGKPLGVLNWFPIHTTSMGEKNLLISGDNKGYASYLFESEMRAQNSDFVAAFANSNCGDVSGNVGIGIPDGIDDIERMEAFGQKQYDRARALYDSATRVLPGLVNYAHTYVDMSNVLVGDDKCTFPAAIGVSMICGSTEDSVNRFKGQGIREGLTKDTVAGLLISEIASDVLMPALSTVVPDLNIPDHDEWPTRQMANGAQVTFEAGHGAKPIILAHGLAEPVPLSPQIVPLQIIRIGDIALVATPGEFTTMAGRRLRRTVEEALFPTAPGDLDPQAIIVGYANAYSGYVTTQEEYDMQHYEGASTLFGPHTLEAYQQEYAKLAGALRGQGATRVQVDPGPTPPDLSDKQTTLQTGVILDAVPLSDGFGQVINKVATRPVKGEEVVAKFWAGHPKNDLRTGATFLEIQRRFSGGWITIATDHDAATKFEWRRADSSREDTGVSLHLPGTDISALSVATVTWKIPEDEPAGPGDDYRIVHHGDSQHLFELIIPSDTIGEYTGVSPAFQLRDSVGPGKILFRNISTKVNISIYSPHDFLRAMAFKSEDLWDEDTWRFGFDQSMGNWGETAQVRFDWGKGSQNVEWHMINSGTLVKINGVKDVSLE